MGFLDLFIVALMPVLKVLLVTALGLFLAIDRINLMEATTRSRLNNLVFYVLSPALVGSNLANAITLESLVTLWFMPVNIFLTFLIGSALAWVLIKITKTPQHLQGLVIGCCSAGNLGYLPLIILPALCEEENSPFGDSSECSTYATAYASLSMATAALFIWSYTYIIMHAYAKKGNEGIQPNDSQMNPNTSGEITEIISESGTEPLLSHGLPSSEEHSVQIQPHTRTWEKVPILEKIKRRIMACTAKIKLKMLLAPSTIAAIVGFFIGIVSPVREAIIGDDAPLRVIYSSTYLVGEAAIPSVTLIMGANLLKGLKTSGPGISIIVGVTAIRFVVLPLFGVAVVKAAQSFGIAESNSLFQFLLMLQYAVPPAMNIGTMAQLFEAGQSECSVIMLWTYGIATFSLTLWCTFFMWLLA